MDFLKMIRPEDVERLIANWKEQQPLKGTRKEKDYEPPVKLFTPIGVATWLLTELEPDSSLAFGLCDLGLGTPELGYVCLEELADLVLPGQLKIEQDLFFEPRTTLSKYAEDARKRGYILP